MAMKFELQEHLGRCAIVREIGSGATSRVYLARDPFADRDVAIKVFLFADNVNPQTERMMHKAFLAEAALAGKLSHPHIVEILDAVVEPEHSYLVMEYVPGTTLEAHAEVTNLLPLNKVVEIIFKCVRALEYAFQHGVIHRDIKPGNILLSQSGDTKVSDFGASKSLTLVSQDCESRMFPGLMSRWITPCWNAYSSARMHLKMISMTLLRGSRLVTSECASSVVPGTYSMTK